MIKIISLSVLVVAGISLVAFTSCSSLGSAPQGKSRELIESSAQFDKHKGEFVNRIPDVIEKMKKEGFSFSMLGEWLFGGSERRPSKLLPQVSPDLKSFLTPSSTFKVIWFGHSTFLLNLSGKLILVDPVFSDSASPLSFMVKRFQKPVLSLDQLPPVDYILISHDHYDHLDMNTIKFFKNSKVKFITPLGVGSHLIDWGISKSKIVELDWWQDIRFEQLSFTATPSQHFSGRDGINNNQTLWASWVIRDEKSNIFFSGDSGYDIHFKKIGDKFGPFDIAFIESGQYNKRWHAVHLLPNESIQAYKDLRAKAFFPVHWAMFELSFHSWYEPIERISFLSSRDNINLVTPRLGEIYEGSSQQHSLKWWLESATKKEK